MNSGGALIFDNDSNGQIYNCTFNGNQCSGTTGGALSFGSSSSAFVLNSIFWGNLPGEISKPAGNTVTIMTSDVQGGWGEPAHNNIDQDPLFVSDGSGNNHYLSHTATSHPTDSPCIDVGNSSSSSVCYPVAKVEDCLDNYSTRIDGIYDTGTVDMGFHYPVAPCLHTGDPEGNGGVTAGDAQSAADCNGDGSVTAGDAQGVFIVALGLGDCADPL